MHPSFSQWIGAEPARRALIVTLVRGAGASLLLSGPSGSGKSMLLSAVAARYPELVTYLPLSLSAEMLEASYTLGQGGGLRLRQGFLDRLRGRILLIEHLPLHSRELLSSLWAQQERLPQSERATIIATTNPEVGAVPSALLDKFDLFVQLEPTQELGLRKRILREALREADLQEDATFLELLQVTRERLEPMRLLPELQHYIAQVCAEPLTLGHRAELALGAASLAWAAWIAKPTADRSDVDAMRQLALAHRWVDAQTAPPEGQPQEEATEQSPEAPESTDPSSEATDAAPHDEDGATDADQGRDEEAPAPGAASASTGSEEDAASSEASAPAPSTIPRTTTASASDQGQAAERRAPTAEVALQHSPLRSPMQRLRERLGSGRRLYSEQPSHRGRLGRVQHYQLGGAALSLTATLRAALPYQQLRKQGQPSERLIIRSEDWRSRQHRHRGGYHILFVLDCSGSMGVAQRMSLVKGTILELLKEAYVKRDRVGLLTFAQDRAELRVPFTHSAERAAQLLETLPTGGRTPLWLALEQAARYLDAETQRTEDCLPVLVLLTDGRATSSQRHENDELRITRAAEALQRRCYRCLIIDTEQGFLRLRRAEQLAARLEAEYYPLDQIAELRSLLHHAYPPSNPKPSQ